MVFNCYKISSQTAPKLAILSSKIYNIFWGGVKPSLQTPPAVGRGHPLPTPHPSAPSGASFLALAIICPPLFRPWIRPCLCATSVGYFPPGNFSPNSNHKPIHNSNPNPTNPTRNPSSNRAG